MEKIRRAGVPLAEYAGVKPLYGIKTGLNEAFLIDTATRDRLVREDPRSAEIIKPYLRGQDIKRWVPEWRGLWMIFARRGIDIDAYPAVKRHLEQFREQLEPKPRDRTGDRWPGRKPGAYKWYEIQDSVDYWEHFERPKIVTQDLATYSWFCFDSSGSFPVNTCYVWPTADLYLLGWLCSPLAWWVMHRSLQHAINDTLRMFREQVETLPIAPPTDAAREETEPAVGRLIESARSVQEARRATLDWLRMEFAVASPGQKLEEFAALDAFIEEVRKRRPRSAGRLGPGALADLRRGYAEQAGPVRAMRTEAAALERRLSELVNAAYGLTPEEEALLWATAPPRMPRF